MRSTTSSTRAASAAAAAVVLLCVACAPQETEQTSAPVAVETPGTGGAQGDGQAGGQGGGKGGTDAPPVLDPEFAVDPPGPRTGALTFADMLVTDQDTLSDEVVEQIESLDGVEAVSRISMAQVSVENTFYNLAAVDPASYRLFTQAQSAELQEQWDRVAGGEVAVADGLQKKLPVDEAGYLELGIDQDAQQVHVGAWAPQVEQVDLVVNERRAEALGMTMGNALVISTGQQAPAELREPIEDLLGGEASVQDLSVAARLGLDPDAFQTAVLVGTFADAVGTFNYTPIGGGRIAPEPSWVRTHIATEVVPILGSVTCNVAIFPQLKAALGEIVTQGLADEINVDEYAGCYYPRFIAGSTTLSNHSFGTALDFNVPGNLRGTVGEMDRGVVAIFKRWGFAWGGDWNYTDPMHFEMDRIVRPG